MLLNYDVMPGNARVWVYQANRELTNEEIDLSKPIIENFIQNWKRHGKDLKASYTIKYNTFIVLLVDVAFNEVSGCAIDASVNLLKQLGNKFAVDLTNKLNVSFKDGDNINIVSLANFKKFAEQGKVNNSTIVFNNLVETKLEFEQNWEVEANNSWHKRFISETN